MANRLLLRAGTMLTAALLAVGGGFVGAQTAPSPYAVASTSAVAATGSASAPLTAASARPSDAAPPAASATPQAPENTPAAATSAVQGVSVGAAQHSPAPPRAAGTAAAAPSAAIPTAPAAPSSGHPTPATAHASGAAAAPAAAFAPAAAHSVRGVVVRQQEDSLLVRSPAGAEFRVILGPATVIASEGGARGRRPAPGDRALAVGAPRADGALAARAVLLSPPQRPAPRNGLPRPPR